MRRVIIIDILGIDEVSFDEMRAVERHGVRRIDMPVLLKVGYVEYIRFEASELRSDIPDVQRWHHALHIGPKPTLTLLANSHKHLDASYHKAHQGTWV